jgi:outer membrane murein-binding lipoprotein Lpp
VRSAKDRLNPMRVYVNAKEREAIRVNAKAAGMTASRFLCAVGLGSTPRSTLDHEAIAVLAKLHADEGRLGGLLKMYLQDRDPDRRTAERLLRDMESVRSDIRAALRQVAS